MRQSGAMLTSCGVIFFNLNSSRYDATPRPMFQKSLAAILLLVISTDEILLLNTINVRGYPSDHANFKRPTLL